MKDLPRWVGVGYVIAVVSVVAAHGAEAEAHGEHEAEHFHKNHVGLFIGSTESETHDGEKDDRNFTLGIDYERRFTRLFGAGVLVDYVAEGTRELLIGAPLFLHFWKGATAVGAPGVQGERGEGDYTFVVRTGLLWEFEVGRITLAPALLYDFGEHEDLLVFGVNVGVGW